MPKLLFLGDIVGRPGRNFLLQKLPELRERLAVDFIVANGENAAGGAGITGKIASELLSAGVDAITLGDHVWDQKNFENEIDALPMVCRPANLPAKNPGRSHLVIERDGFRLGLFTVLGRNFMGLKADGCPFRVAEAHFEELRAQCDAVMIEAHMEATSEKIALGWHFDGRAAAVIGTHTHVPTADGRILPGGTAYQTDAGMCGDYNSVIGMNKENAILKFFKKKSDRLVPVIKDATITGIKIVADDKTGLAKNIEPIVVGGNLKFKVN